MVEVYSIRHGAAEYKPYKDLMAGPNPQGQFEANQQSEPDLTEAGKESARQDAEAFLDTLDPKTDQLFLVSSNEARAIETASIFRVVALEKGFTIIKPEHSRSKLADKLGQGEVRVLEALSLNKDGVLARQVFQPNMPTVNWAAVDSSFAQNWRQARALVEADNRGSWGANFAAHSEAVKKLLPVIETVKELYDSKFKILLRYLKWADGKIKKEAPDSGIKLLAFGHENYVLQMLMDEFGEEGIKNCEAIKFETDGAGAITATFRGKSKKLNE